MNTSNSGSEFARIFCQTQSAALQLENARAELRALVPEDAALPICAVTNFRR